jgi:NAD(P)-dependent dehydrogenase (short-subunit alcohol dehydrogenase family)
MSRFESKVAIVTGAASGVGRATAQRLASEGASVYGLDVDETGLKETAALVAESGGRIETGVHDLSRRANCHEAVRAAVAAHGRVDVLANVAGVSRFHIFDELTEDEFDFIMGVNVKGVAFMCQAALPHLLESKGAIVNVASIAGLIGQAYTVAYCASKGAVVQLTRALAMEYVNTGLRVNAVAPGGVDTAMNTTMQFPEAMDWKLVKPYMGRRGMCQPEEIAGAIAYLASDEARFVHGAVLSVDGGVAAGG